MNHSVVLITGSNRGIGKGLVTRYLAMHNTTVLAGVRDPSSASSNELLGLPAGLGSTLIVIKLDMSIESTISETLSRVENEHNVNHIDLVISNAGIGNHWGPVSQMTDSDMLTHFEVNTLGTLRLFKSVDHLLKASKQPKFVYLSSELASIAGLENSSSLTCAYGVSKAAGNYLVKKIHEEEAELIAFSIDPGFVQTDMGNLGAQLGGLAKAPMTISESVEGIMSQIDVSTKTTSSGKFLRFNGAELLW